MKFVLVSLFLIGFTFAQTRPTGGTGPDVSSNSNNDENFYSLVSLIETTVELNFDQCQTGMIRPKTFSLKEIYQLLNSMNALNHLSRLNGHKRLAPTECDDTSMQLSPQMICLMRGLEPKLDLLTTYPRGYILISRRFNMRQSEATYMLNFFDTIRMTRKTQIQIFK